MSAPPYMKLFWGDYHKKTRHLTRAAQHGAYLLLIGEAWQQGGSLPDDDVKLAAWADCTADEWSVLKPTVMDFFNLRRGKWVHDRVREELASYEATSRKRKEAGRKGGSASLGKDSDNPQAIASQKPTKPEPEPEPEPLEEAIASPSGKAPAKGKAKRKPEIPIPDGFPDAEALDDARSRAAADGKELNAATEAERFRNHAAQIDRRARDWRAAWRNWVITALERAPQRPGASGAGLALAAIPKFPNAAIREYVVQHKGEPWAVSYLDPCEYAEADGVRTITAPNTYTAGKLRTEVPALEARGIRIALPPLTPVRSAS
jgi:uncharacterized protein YdaU (DUF1376 family)